MRRAPSQSGRWPIAALARMRRSLESAVSARRHRPTLDDAQVVRTARCVRCPDSLMIESHVRIRRDRREPVALRGTGRRRSRSARLQAALAGARRRAPARRVHGLDPERRHPARARSAGARTRHPRLLPHVHQAPGRRLRGHACGVWLLDDDDERLRSVDGERRRRDSTRRERRLGVARRCRARA